MTLVALLLCLLCLAVPSAEATIYYLKPSTGLDTNNGTSTSTPWKTFTKAKGKTCGGGSSACLAPGDTLRIMGGTYTPTQYKGTSGIVKWTQNDSLGTANNVITITNNPGETVIFDGQGTEDYWIMFNASVASYNGHYILIDGTAQNLQWTNYKAVTVAFRGDSTTIFTHHVGLQNAYIHDNFELGSGGIFNWNARHTLFRNNRIAMVGIGAVYGSHRDHSMYISEVSQNVLIEGNVLEHAAGYGIHLYGHFNMAVINNNNIIRKNTMISARESCLLLTGSVYKDNYIYNNTCYSEPIPRPDIVNASAISGLAEHLTKSWDGQRIINNIWSGYYSTASINVVNFSQLTTNLTMDYNLYRNLTNSAWLFRWDADDTTTTRYTLAGFQGATVYEDHGLSSDPLFVNAPAGNFSLGAGSPAIDAGRDLTTAVGAGSSSTTLTVADAGYFFDGYGLVTGDSIKIGSAALVTITNVNLTTNVITLSAARSWSNGDPVNLAFTGAKPDIGAFEAPGSVLVFTTQPVSTQIGVTMANVVVTNQDGAGNTLTSFVGTVTLEKTSGPGTVGGTLTQTAVAGVATFNDLTVDTVGTYVLLATAAGATSGTSTAFDGTPVPTVPATGVIPLKITRIR